MTPDRPLLGIVLMLFFCILAPLGDSLAKILGGTVPMLVLLSVRFAIQGAILVPVAAASGVSLRLSRRDMALTALRTALHLAGSALMFLALRFLPLAETIAIAYVMPFVLLLLGHTILHEEVGPRRLLACVVGFAGTMMVVQPTFSEAGAPALLPLVVAVIFALFMLVTRQVARAADPVALQAVSGVMASAVLLPVWALAWAAGLLTHAAGPPGAGDWGLLLALGLLGTAAHLFMTWSLRFAPASTVAPMQYLEIPFAAAIGWLIFAEFPNRLALAGIAVTVAAGLYIIIREGRIKTPKTPGPPM